MNLLTPFMLETVKKFKNILKCSTFLVNNTKSQIETVQKHCGKRISV